MVKVLPTTLLVSNLTPIVLQPLDFAVDDVARQAERRDAVLQHAAKHMQRLIDRDVGPVADQVGRRGKPRRAGAGDRHLAELVLDHGRHGLGRARIVANEAFEPADGNGLVLLMLDDDALRLALRLLRTDAAANRGEDARLVDRLQRGIDIVQEKLPDEGGDVDADRAAGDAGGLFALDAALGFAVGIGYGIAEVDLLEVGGALGGVALGHRHLMRLDRRKLLVGALAVDDERLLKIADVAVSARWPGPLRS